MVSPPLSWVAPKTSWSMSACRGFCSPIFRSATRLAGRRTPCRKAFTLDLALSVLETAPAPRTTVQNPLKWSASPDWKLDYSNIERLTPEEIKRRRAEFDKGKAQAKNVRMEAGRAILARGDRQQH